MSNPALPNGRDHRSPFRLRAKTGLKKKLPRKIPRNPLISLDSDERIQGNPRNSNPPKQGFPRRNGADPRKPKLIDAFRQGLLRPVRQSHYRRLAADPDVVLRVAGGIVRIAAGIIRAAVRLSGGIDRLIGVAAGEHERHKSQDDRDPHSRPPVQWRPRPAHKRPWCTWRSSSIVQDEAASPAGRRRLRRAPPKAAFAS
jgi:hypothetical protein